MRLTLRLGLVVAPVFFLIVAAAGAFLLTTTGQAPPTQPIAFSHLVHANEKQIACTYCHQGVAKSAVAGIPSVEKCMGCHRTVAVDSPEVRKVAAYWERKEPIAWARLAYLPDHVYFSHQPHIQAGKECQTCHGSPSLPNGSFGRLQPGMDWCLSCHRRDGASIDCSTCHK
ncbi:MAG: cytochrome c3 family protein [Chloroflexi bacterium]|nr:cytochrome c3 family protein [Chloroflexota bacterium]